MTHRLPTFFTSTALVLALYPDLKGVFFFFSQAIFCLLYFIPPIHTLSLLFAWLETHPPIAWICWHTNIVFRKQNNPGNNAGIWKWVISLDGWVSNPWASKQGRERERERECRGALFILPRPDGEGSFGCCTPPLPVRPWHAHNTQTQLPQLVCTAVVKASYTSYSLIWLFLFFSICCWDWGRVCEKVKPNLVLFVRIWPALVYVS